jgi:hypothetical protein
MAEKCKNDGKKTDSNELAVASLDRSVFKQTLKNAPRAKAG